MDEWWEVSSPSVELCRLRGEIWLALSSCSCLRFCLLMLEVCEIDDPVLSNGPVSLKVDRTLLEVDMLYTMVVLQS
jgi:hypothetical protein